MTNLDLLESVKFDIKNALIDKQLPIFGGLSTYAESIKYSGRCPLPNGTMLKGSTFVTVPDYDFSMITDMSDMFRDCKYLTTIPQLDTSNVTNMDSMFDYCESLTSIPLLDTSNVKYFGNAFRRCVNLQNLGGFIGLKVSIRLYWSTLLTHESLMNVINNLAVVTTSPTLTLGESNLAKLTDDEIAIATDKGWIVN